MKTLIKIFILFSGIAISAQNIPNIKINDSLFLGISSLDINVEVVGNIATTTYDMLF